MSKSIKKLRNWHLNFGAVDNNNMNIWYWLASNHNGNFNIMNVESVW